MRLMCLSVILVLTASIPTMGSANGSPTILVVGDSLSAGYGLELGTGWVDLLAERLRNEGYEHRVVNASVSGDTTSGGLARLGPALEKHDPELVVIELGGNDGLRGLPLNVVRRNFREMIGLARGADAGVVLLGMRIPENYGRRYTEAFASLYTELAAEFDLPLTDFFMDGVALDPALMQSDGIHPNAAGQQQLLDNAWPAIETALTRLGQTGAVTAPAAAAN